MGQGEGTRSPTVLVSRGSCWGRGVLGRISGCSSSKKLWGAPEESQVESSEQSSPQLRAGMEVLSISFPFPMSTCPQVASRGVDAGHG